MENLFILLQWIVCVTRR